MQNELPGLLILGLFVVLFGSIYRERGSARLRYWLIGWLMAELHLAAEAMNAASSLSHALSLCALIVCSLCFLLSASLIAESRRWRLPVILLLGVPALFYAIYSLFFSDSAAWPLYAAAGIVAVGGTSLAWGLFRSRIRLLICLLLVFVTGELGTLVANLHHHPIYGISPLLAELFLTFAALFWFDFRRFSAGVLITMGGLAACATIYPLSLVWSHFWPGAVVERTLWHLPLYLVAFGMILTLLEDEIFAAGKASEHYRLLFAANPHPMWIHDRETLRFLRVNEAAVNHYGYSREEFHSMTLRDLRLSAESEAVPQETERLDSFTLSGPWRHRKKDGSEIQVDIAAQSIDFQGRDCQFVLVNDVTDRQRLHLQLLHQAHHDSLTGLPNRLLLEDRMQQTFALAKRREKRAAVVCLDLDRFKEVNDSFGHAAGDRCLKQIAEHLSQRLRSADTIARTGGEEFVVVLGDLVSLQDADRVANDLLKSVRLPIETEGQLLCLSASAGIALFPDDGSEPAELWCAADRAMYRAKRAGGNQAFFASSERGPAGVEQAAVESSMRGMLADGGFELYYQPIYSMTRSLCGFEALVRLNDPQLGPIQPHRFLPFAEARGLIGPIGKWVLEEVCRQIAEWEVAGLSPPRVSINLSAEQIARHTFLDEVDEALSRHGIDPTHIGFEVPEKAVMAGWPELPAQLRRLAGLGAHLAIDDFGIGLCSLTHLHRLPVSTLKIDGSLVERISDSEGAYPIVQAAVALGHGLGLQLVAEGVESAHQADALRNIGCDFMQGYLLSAPISARGATALLRRSIIPRFAPARALVAELKGFSRG